MIRAIVVAACLLATPALAGDGIVDFSFTSFSGPYAYGNSAGNISSAGLVNGSIPTYASSVSINGTPTAIGTTALSGDSATFVYNFSGAGPNIVTFMPHDFSNISPGEDFVLGTIAYTNGQWFGGSPDVASNTPVYLNFEINTHSSTPAFNQTITGAIKVVTNVVIGGSTTCNGSLSQARDEADFLTVESSANLNPIGSLRVFDSFCEPAGETNSGTIDLVAHFNSLDLVGLANPGGSGFYVDSTDIGAISPAPEPAAWATMIFGMGAIGAAHRRRRALAPA